jgi:hypothetical protein
VGATTDGNGTDTDQQSTGQRCSRNPATGICLQAIRKSGKSIGLSNVSPADFNQGATMFKQKGFAEYFSLFSLFMLAIFLLGAVGWVWNIVKIIGTGFDVLTGMLIARCIGVFIAPLGAVLGYL